MAIDPITPADHERRISPPHHGLPPLCDAEVQSMTPGICIVVLVCLFVVCFLIDCIGRSLMPSEIETKIQTAYVEKGWTPAGWSDRLRTLAATCEPDHPDRAAELRRWADAVDAKHPLPIVLPPIEIPDEVPFDPTSINPTGRY